MAEETKTPQTGNKEGSRPGHPGVGEIYLEWEIDEFPRYRRGPLWYLLMLAAGFGLLIYSVVNANFLFTLIILMLGLVIYMTATNEPGKTMFSVAESGVRIGQSVYPYRELSRFWFIYEPPEVKTLHLDFKNPMRPRVVVDLEDQNPNQVREILGRFVHEDFTEDEEPFADYIGRIFKI